MTDRKFFKTTITVVVLSEDEPLQDGLPLDQVAYLIEEGDCSGETHFESVEISAKEAAQALIGQGSDPELFRLSDEGEDLDD